MNDYSTADRCLHLLCQTLAKASRTYVPKKEDDSHTSLFFDPLGNRIMGRWIDVGTERMLLSINLNDWTFEWITPVHKVLQTIPISGKTVAQIEEELEEKLVQIGLNPARFRDPLHFDIPDYGWSQKALTTLPPPHLTAWRRWRAQANCASQKLLDALQAEGDVRIWPHHFDTGIFVPLGKRSLGFGLAMEDEAVGCPYYYLRGYEGHDNVPYIDLPDLAYGRWELSERLMGAILPLTSIQDLGTAEADAAVDGFMWTCLQWLVRPMGLR